MGKRRRLDHGQVFAEDQQDEEDQTDSERELDEIPDQEFEFEDPPYNWNGGTRVKGGEVDEYEAENPSAIKEWLIPLELVNKKACYVNKRNNLADRLSKKFVSHNTDQTVLVRYFMLIDSAREWAEKLGERQYRLGKGSRASGDKRTGDLKRSYGCT